MKTICTAIIATILLPIAMMGQSYTKMWKKVEKAQADDLPKTALSTIDKIISTAQSHDNQAELIKAYIMRIQLAEGISSDSANAMLPRVEAMADKQTRPADKCIWHMVEGWLYANRNMRLYPESKQKALEAYKAATSNPAALAEASSKDYMPIVDRASDSRYYNHDMLSVVYPFVAKEMRKLKTMDADVLSHEIMGKEIAWYKSHNNREATLLAKLDSARITHRTTDEFLQNLIYEYADIPLVTEARVALIPSLNNKEKYDFINETLQKYPNTTQTNTLRNLLEELTRSQVECKISDIQIYPGEQAQIYVTHKNMTSATISYTRLPYAASDSVYQELKSSDFERFAAKKDFEMQLSFKKDLAYDYCRDTFNIQMPKSGLYLVKLEGADAEPTYDIIHVSALAVIQLPQPKQKVKVCVIDFKNGKPVANAHLRIKYYLDSGYYWQDCDADQNGELIIESSKHNADIYPSTPDDKALSSVSLTRSYDYNWNRKDHSTSLQMHTDRAIYRPGQNVKVGGFLFKKDGDSTRVLNGTAFEIKLYSANNKMLESAMATTDELGAFGTEFTLPQECLNGRFRLETQYGSAYFKVEEYKRPKFYVTLQAPDKAYSLGDTITVAGEVKTYSGMPMGETKLVCSSERNRSWWFYSDNNDTPATVRDTITTDSEGRFELPVVMSYPANSDLRYRYMVYTYKVCAKATAADGETEEGIIYINAGNWSSYVSLNIPSVICKEQMPTIVASQTNSIGNSVKGKGYYVLKQNNDTLRSGTIDFNQKGQFDFIQSLPSGQYRLTVKPADDDNKYNYASESFTLISLNDTKPVGSDKLQVWSDGSSFPKDKPASIIVGTPLKDTWLRYDLVANEKVIDSKLIHLSDSVMRFDYTYDEAYGNGIHAQFAIYDNGSLVSKSVTFTKPLPDKSLQIKWTTFRDKLQPGANEKWTMQILKDNKPVSASVLATMYDASLDKFGKHSLPFGLYYDRDIPLQRWSFYYRRDFTIRSIKKLNKQYENSLMFTIPASKIFNPYGDMIVLREMAVGGARPAMLYKNVEPAFESAEQALRGQVAGLDATSAEQDLTQQVEIRSDFNETAFFASSLKTNSMGEVRIEFKLPQSLTSWNFRALAHTANLDYAFADTLITVEKPVAVQANMPRFLRSGDKTILAINIINNTDKPQTGKAQLALTDAQSGKQIKLLTQNFSLKANQRTVVNFPIEASINNPLLVCKYVAVTKDFSDGEQQYLPVLSDLQHTLTTVPFSLTDTAPHSIALDALDYQPNALQSTLTVEYSGNPAWTAIEALPSTIDYKTQCSTSLGINYSALTIMRQLIQSNPQIKALAQNLSAGQQSENPFMALESNPELKQFVLSETPWLCDANSERMRIEELLQDENTLTLKQASMLDKLRKMQTPSGGWQWFPGMSASTWLTIDITEMLIRTRNICPSSAPQIDPIINKAVAYLDKQAEAEVKELKEHKVRNISTLWMRYLYITAKGNWQKTSARKYLLDHLAQSATSYDLYDKAMAASILKATGKDKEALATVASLKEYIVSTPEMGSYFDGRKAPVSWSMYRIPTQVAAIEAINDVTPQDTKTLSEMRIWLLQSKHTQDWSSPLAATMAIQCLLSTQMLAAPTALPAKLEIATAANKSIDITDYATINPMIEMGYIKSTRPTAQLGSAPAMLNVQQSAATIEQPLSYGAVYLQNYMPSSAIAAAGSELTLTAKVFKQTANGWAPVSNGATLQIGDRIMVRYEIEAARDFDFVALKDGRAACMEPTSTASGYYRGYYRSVEDATTNWFFDKLHKGKHAIEETYDIDRTGTFTTACPQLQCQYAPEFTARARNFTIQVK